jgi:uncharacterized protein YbcI
MAQRYDSLTTSGDPGPDGNLLPRISTEMVQAMKQYYGKGPVSAKSYVVDDLLFVVMRGGITQAEQTMLDAGREDTVRRFRQEFENEMTPRLISMVEQLTGRRVVNYQSQVLFDPDMTVEIFVFDDDTRPDQLGETTQAVTARGSRSTPM